MLPDAQFGGVDQPVNDVRIAFDPVVDELRLLVAEHEERGGFAHAHRRGEPDKRPPPVVKGLKRRPGRRSLDDLNRVIEVEGIQAYDRSGGSLFGGQIGRLRLQPRELVLGVVPDDDSLVRHHTSEEQRKELVERFLKEDDPLQILVVCDMLLTGFDAPVEQVMYLDSPLKEHTLLQAIARVNRTAEKKTYGLIVDYWGVSEDLQEALAIFAPGDIQGALVPKTDELPRLQARHAAALRFFVNVKNRDDLDACVTVLEPEDVRAEFDQAFKRFAQSLDMMLPDPKAQPYVGDARWLGKIRATAAAKYRDEKLDISDCGAKVRQLIEDAVIAEGIQLLVKQISLFTPEFEEKLNALKSDAAKASEMEHAIRHEIHVKLEENPAFFRSLRERLEQIIEDRKAKRIDAAQQLKLFEALTKEMRGQAQAAQAVGLSETGFAIYGLIVEPRPATVAETKGPPYGQVDEAKRDLAGLLEELLVRQTDIVDWQHKEDVQREMRRLIKKQLKVASYPAAKIDTVTESVVDLLKRRGGRS